MVGPSISGQCLMNLHKSYQFKKVVCLHSRLHRPLKDCLSSMGQPMRKHCKKRSTNNWIKGQILYEIHKKIQISSKAQNFQLET